MACVVKRVEIVKTSILLASLHCDLCRLKIPEVGTQTLAQANTYSVQATDSTAEQRPKKASV